MTEVESDLKLSRLDCNEFADHPCEDQWLTFVI